MTPVAVVLGAVGLVLGLAADRLATRWPEHEAPFVAGRQVGWRTVAVAGFGAAALGLVGLRFGLGRDLAVLLLYVLPLILLFATDLDQRLLPDVVTLPLVGYAALVGLLGLNPLVGGGAGMVGPALLAILVPLVIYLPSIPFGAGALGLGDIKFLVSAGLILGFPRELLGLSGAAIVTAVVLGILLASGRIGRRTYVPFGPFLLIGVVWGMIVPT